MTNAPELSEILKNAEYLAHRYDEFGDAFRFSLVPRDLHRQCTFITDEHLPDDLAYIAIDHAKIEEQSKPKAPVHFIFHSAYCCSTMLARAFDIDGVSMGLKEPQVLNDMIGWQRRGAPTDKRRAALDQSLTLLERPFEGDRAVVIKPSNICTPLAIPMLEMRPDAKALFLYAPIESFLQSIVKKEMWGRIWVRDVLLGQRQDGYMIGGFTDDDLLKLTDLQVAAVGWLSQHAAFAKVIDAFGPERTKTLDSQTLLERSSDTVAALSQFYDLVLKDSEINAVLAGPAFNSHSKLDQAEPGEVFDANTRAQEQSRMAEIHGQEINMVTQWAAAVADSQGIRMEIGSELLS